MWRRGWPKYSTDGEGGDGEDVLVAHEAHGSGER